MKQLNAKEQAVWDYICRVTKEKGYAPSVRDIKEALGYKSTSTVQMYLDRLLSYGVLLREDGKCRSLRVNAELLETERNLVPILCGDEGNSLPAFALLRHWKGDTAGLFLRRIGKNHCNLPEDAWLLCSKGANEGNVLFALSQDLTGNLYADNDLSVKARAGGVVAILREEEAEVTKNDKK